MSGEINCNRQAQLARHFYLLFNLIFFIMVKVGDKVRIKSYEVLFEKSQKPIDIMSCFLPLQHAGKVVTVTDIKDGLYRIDLFTGGFYWEDYLFEKVNHNKDENENEDNKDVLHEELVKDLASIISKHNLSVKVEEKDGGLFVKPIEKKEDDLLIGTPVVASNNTGYWALGIYKGNGEIQCDLTYAKATAKRKYIIPFDKFNPLDINESLKHNIAKND